MKGVVRQEARKFAEFERRVRLGKQHQVQQEEPVRHLVVHP